MAMPVSPQKSTTLILVLVAWSVAATLWLIAITTSTKSSYTVNNCQLKRESLNIKSERDEYFENVLSKLEDLRNRLPIEPRVVSTTIRNVESKDITFKPREIQRSTSNFKSHSAHKASRVHSQRPNDNSLKQDQLRHYYSQIFRTGIDDTVENYTMVILTYKRTEILPKILMHYCSANRLQAILVLWNDNENPIPQSIVQLTTRCKVKLIFKRSEENKLTNRFRLADEEIETDCVCIMDDDRIVDLDDLEYGFNVWQSFRQRVVGYEERSFKVETNGSYTYTNYERTSMYSRLRSANSKGHRIVHVGDRTIHIVNGRIVKENEINDTFIQQNKISPLTGYSIMLTATAFVHRAYLEMFFDPMMVPEETIEYIDSQQNCEDVMLSVMVTKFLEDISWPQCGVLAVKTRKIVKNLEEEAYKLGGHEGLSMHSNHYIERSKCLNKFAGFYNGTLPLHSSTIIIDHA